MKLPSKLQQAFRCITMLSPDERRAKRVQVRVPMNALPEHLRLGVTLPGMRELLSQLPSDAVEQANAKIPTGPRAAGPLDCFYLCVNEKPKFPENMSVNGYVNKYFITNWAKLDKLAVCERLLLRGSPHVGEATVFVSWFLSTPIDTLLDALANFLKQKGLREEDTFFWVCDYVIRQTDVKTDLKWLGDCVSAVGHTVLLMEPWHAPAPLKRAYCIKEVYHTQKSGAQFDVTHHRPRRHRRPALPAARRSGAQTTKNTTAQPCRVDPNLTAAT